MAVLPTVPDSESVVDPPDTGRLGDEVSRWRIVAIVVAMVLLAEVATFQLSMVGSGLQKITKTFSDVGSDINWALILPGIVGAATAPIMGKFSDIWGKKRIFLVCGLLFLVGCLVDAVTSNWWVFLAGRALQASSGAMLVITYGLVRDLLPRRNIPIALGLVSGGVGFSAIAGPVLAGLLVGHFDWRAMFWFLAAYTLATMVLFLVVVPESTLRVRQRIQPYGVLLLSAGTLLMLIYLDKGHDWGWGRPMTLAWLIVGVVLVGLFYLVESRSSNPIMDVKLLVSPKVGLTLLLMLFGVAVLAVVPTATGYMTQTPGQDAVKQSVVQGVIAQAHQAAGINLSPDAIQVALDPGYTYGNGYTLLSYALHVSIMIGIVGMIFGPIGGLLARRIGARIPAIIGTVVLALVCVGFGFVVSSSWVVFAVLAGVMGIGFAFLYSSGSVLIVDALPEEQQGIGSGMFGVTLGISSAIGTAVLAAFQSAYPINAHVNVMGHAVTQPIPQVFADRAYQLTFWSIGGMAVLALIVALIMRHGREPSTAGVVTH